MWYHSTDCQFTFRSFIDDIKKLYYNISLCYLYNQWWSWFRGRFQVSISRSIDRSWNSSQFDSRIRTTQRIRALSRDDRAPDHALLQWWGHSVAQHLAKHSQLPVSLLRQSRTGVSGVWIWRQPSVLILRVWWSGRILLNQRAWKLYFAICHSWIVWENMYFDMYL